MKLFKEVIKNNLKMIIFYVLIGIIINFLDLYSVTYYQKILDSFQFKTLTLTPLIIYGLLLIIATILGYIENYPEQQVKNKLYFFCIFKAKFIFEEPQRAITPGQSAVFYIHDVLVRRRKNNLNTILGVVVVTILKVSKR